MSDEPRPDRLRRLLDKARALPEVPGVYLMKDTHGTVVYVGKALRLCDRVSSYFLPSTDLGRRKSPMLELVVDFDIIECESEMEALFTENRLVKDLKPPPRFNVRLRDDKSYPYLAVRLGEDYPRVEITRSPNDPVHARSRVFGPFLSGNALREAVSALQRVFKFRTCELTIVPGDEKNRFFRPCLLHPIGRCSAPCAERIDPARYREDIERFVRFITSKRSAMLRELRGAMDEASATQDYERAATLRDQVLAIQKLDDRADRADGYQPWTEIALLDPEKGGKSLMRALGLSTPARCVEGFDIAHLQGSETVASKVCFVDGKPFKEAYRRFKIRTVGNDDYAAMREVISRRYRDVGDGQEVYPDVILIDGGPGQLNAALEALRDHPVQPAMIVSLAKQRELVYVPGRDEPIRLSRSNPGLRLLQAVRDEAHRFAQAYHHVLRRKDLLGE